MKNKFIKSTIILMFGGLITKILGMIIKIALTRAVSTKGIGLYSLILMTCIKKPLSLYFMKEYFFSNNYFNLQRNHQRTHHLK